MRDRLFEALRDAVWGADSHSLHEEIAKDPTRATALVAVAFEEKLVPQLLQSAGDALPSKVRDACGAIISRQQTWCDRVLDSLPPGCVVAKGPTIDWDDASLGPRQFADIDVFVPTTKDAARLTPVLESIGLTRRPISHVAFRHGTQAPRCLSLRFMPEKYLPGFGGAEVQIGGFPITDSQSFDGSWLWANSVPWRRGDVELRRLNEFALFCLVLSNFVYRNKQVRLRDLMDVKALAARVPVDRTPEIRQLVARHGLQGALRKFEAAFASLGRSGELPDLVRALSDRAHAADTEGRSSRGLRVRSTIRDHLSAAWSDSVSELKRIAHSPGGPAWRRRAVRFVLERNVSIRVFQRLGVVLLHHEARSQGLIHHLDAGLPRPVPGCLTIISIDPPASQDRA